MPPAKTPLSIEAILEQQRRDKEAQSRPKFLSKQERQALALQKRAQEVEDAKERELDAHRKRDQLEEQARKERDSLPHGGGGGGNSSSSHYHNGGGGYNGPSQGYTGPSGQGDGRYSGYNGGAGAGNSGALNYGSPQGDYHGGRGGAYGGRGGRGRGRGGLGYDGGRPPPSGPREGYDGVPSGPSGRGGMQGRGGAHGGGGGGGGRYDDRWGSSSGGRGGYGQGQGSGRYGDDARGPNGRDGSLVERSSGVVNGHGGPRDAAAMDVDRAAQELAKEPAVAQPAPVRSSSPPRNSTEQPPPPPPNGDAPPPPPLPSDAPPAAPAPKEPTPPPQGKLTLAELAELNARSSAASSSSSAAAAGPVLNAQLQAARYLGARAPDKRKRTKKQGNKVDFDWDRTDDTLAGEVDPIYAPYTPAPPAAAPAHVRDDRHAYNKPARDLDRAPPARPVGAASSTTAAQPMRVTLFGRGRLAGFDADVEKVPGRKARGALDERHWAEKSLAEMRDRDWRIFREDFSIGARGALSLALSPLSFSRSASRFGVVEASD